MINSTKINNGNRAAIFAALAFWARLVIPALALFCAAPAFALPGFTPSVADASGDYVYYEDKTFARTSYLGFLRYDETTYAARYYAPPKNDVPSLTVSMFFTINSNVDYVEITGERLVSGRTEDDTFIINYLHDMLYEFNARRVKADDVLRAGETMVRGDFRGDFMQFGENVAMRYDALVPLFNLRDITDANGDALLELITVGRLASSDDNAFNNFTGLPDSYAESPRDGGQASAPSETPELKIDKNAKAQVYATADGKRIALDENWTRAMENLWTLGNAAIVSLVAVPQGLAGDALCRRLLQSAGSSYIDWRTVAVSKNESGVSMSCVSYDAQTKRATRVIRKLAESGALFTLTVFESAYAAERNYFDEIAASYAAD